MNYKHCKAAECCGLTNNLLDFKFENFGKQKYFVTEPYNCFSSIDIFATCQMHKLRIFSITGKN